jgi:hypothetical protein
MYVRVRKAGVVALPASLPMPWDAPTREKQPYRHTPHQGMQPHEDQYVQTSKIHTHHHMQQVEPIREQMSR